MNTPAKAAHREGEARRWEIALSWLLRALVLGTAVWHIAQGATLYALLCLAAIALVMIPAFLARTSRANLPFEVEVVLLWWLVTDMTLGRALGLYDATDWYDKVLHFGNSILLGMVGFLAVYVMHHTGRLRASPVVSGLGIVFVTLGIGAIWEIAEYVADLMFGLGAQGSPWLGPLDDTMSDLMLDGAGGIVGAILGPMYMRLSKRSRQRAAAFAKLGSACEAPPG
jgi:hypothetical protein